MKKLVFALAIAGMALNLSGCENNQEIPDHMTKSNEQIIRGRLSTSPVGIGTITASKTRKLHYSPTELAQQEYKDAYNEYVRHLRESGPQTIATLEALANYQRKYQIYQMLLNAD